MRDPWNPIQAEIRDWAYDKDALEPDQDCDLALANLREFDIYVELAADDDCPKWDYFLRILYLIVGDAVRTDYQTEPQESVLALLENTRRFAKPRFVLLRVRAEHLFAHPNTFDYNDWCGGGLVTQDQLQTPQ